MDEEERAKKEKCKRESPGILIGRAGRSSYINGSKRDERRREARANGTLTGKRTMRWLAFSPSQPSLVLAPCRVVTAVARKGDQLGRCWVFVCLRPHTLFLRQSAQGDWMRVCGRGARFGDETGKRKKPP